MYCLFRLRFSRFDYMLMFFSILFVISILFSYEYEQGYVYIVSTSRYRMSIIFLYKIITLIIVVLVPYVLAKAIAVVFSDPRVLVGKTLLFVYNVLFMFCKQLLYVLYITGFILIGANIIHRLGYTIIPYTLYFVLFESPLSIHGGLLKLFPLYVDIYVSWSFNDILDTISSNAYLCVMSTVLFIISYFVYVKREVRI